MQSVKEDPTVDDIALSPTYYIATGRRAPRVGGLRRSRSLPSSSHPQHTPPHSPPPCIRIARGASRETRGPCLPKPLGPQGPVSRSQA